MKLRRVMLLALSAMLVVIAKAQKPQEYNLQVGNTFTLNVEVDQSIEQEIMGQTQETTQKLVNVDEYEVVAVDGDNYKLKITGIKRVIDLDSPMGASKLDSDLEGDEHLPAKATVGFSYHVTMSKYGKLIEVHDFDEYREEVRKSFTGTSMEGVADTFLANITESSVGATFQSFFQIYSAEGKSQWSTETDMVINSFPTKAVTDFERTGETVLNSSGTLSLEGDLEIQGMPVKAEMSGIQTTAYDLDAKTGVSKTISMDQDLSGSLEVQGMSIPMSIKSISKGTIVWK